jgi:hypothetical protein
MLTKEKPGLIVGLLFSLSKEQAFSMLRKLTQAAN